MPRISISKETQKRLLRYFGYSAAFFVSFLLFVYFTFPWERLVKFALQEAESRAGLTIDVEGFSPSLGTGIVADRVVIYTKPNTGEKEGDTYILTDVSARLSFFALLGGNYKVSFEGDLLGGHVEGTLLSSDDNEKEIDFAFQSIDLSEIEIIATYIGAPAFGNMEGTFALQIPNKGIKAADGAINLNIVDGKIGEKGSKLNPSASMGGRKTPGYDQSFTLKEGASLGRFTCQIDVSNGKGNIKECAADGGDVEASLEGSLRLNDRMLSSVLSGLLKFRFDEGYAERNAMTLFLTAPNLTQAKTEDGFFSFNMNAPLNRLKFRPTKRTAPKTTIRTPSIGRDVPGRNVPPLGARPLSPTLERETPIERPQIEPKTVDEVDEVEEKEEDLKEIEDENNEEEEDDEEDDDEEDDEIEEPVP